MSLTASSPFSLGSVISGGVQCGSGEVFGSIAIFDQRRLVGFNGFLLEAALEPF
jgi:hypothetical protein